MIQFNDHEIRKAVKVLSDELDRKHRQQAVYLIIVGAASLILKFHLRRTTSDIDILDRITADHNIFGGIGQLLSRMGFHIVSEVMVNLHPDYAARLELYEQHGHIRVLTLHPYDLAISKIGRGFSKDIDDLLNSNVLAHLDLQDLETLYFEAVGYWIGDERTYHTNWDMFVQAYDETRRV